jgi:hypothetical protein
MPTLKNDVTGTNEIAIVGASKHHHGVAGESKEDGAGVLGVSRDGEGVSGFSKTGHGVVGQSDVASGVRGLSKSGRAVEGLSETGGAVFGVTDSGAGVTGGSSTGHGVVGHSESASGVRGVSQSGRGVEGWSESAYGVSGDSARSAGVRGTSVEGRGVEGWSTRSEGVFGFCETGTGVWGVAGRSRFFGKFGVGADIAVFRVGGAAKQWADSLATVTMTQEPPTALAMADRQDGPHTETTSAEPQPATASEHAEHASPQIPLAQAAVIDDVGTTVIVDGPAALDLFDDTAGIGVCGEHRGGGIGVKAVSQSGIGIAAYSTGYEAVHAETHSPNTAAIAAYNLNPQGGGAAVFAKKVGPRGYAGFFDGRVWVGGELAVGGDILLANADCAEDFDVSNASSAAPGTVMVVGEDGVLHPSTQAYDKCVAGVISGAGNYKPGLILDKQPSCTDRAPVALLGKVCCQATAEYGAIEVGDLLTTSPIVGHAMKASDPARAFGAVIGKALRSLREGQGLIPILIALQ